MAALKEGKKLDKHERFVRFPFLMAKFSSNKSVQSMPLVLGALYPLIKVHKQLYLLKVMYCVVHYNDTH